MRSMARVEGVGFYRCRQAWCAGLVRLLAGVTMCVLLGSAGAAAEVTVLTATEYGLQADGVHDDGPAIRRLLAAVAAAAGPVRAVFPAGRTIRVATGTERYVFALDRASRLTLDGGGSTFLLTPDLRFLRLTHSEQITLCRLNIDVAPLPFVDGTVVAVAAAQRTLDVQTSPGEALRALGGPTHADGEQAFFGMLWQEGAYGLLGRHYWIERMEAGSGPGRVRVTATSAFSEFADIVPGAWRISLPVPGNAHRYGPGACLDISDNDTVTLEDVEVWSAPWFGVEVIRNRGHVTFRRVHIRPPPGSGRLTSTWRDGFHVKGNSATLLWEDCILAGMNDDAFNISTHCSSVQERVTPTRLVVLQTFPLGPMPWHEGNTLAAADFASRTRLGSARIVGVIGVNLPMERIATGAKLAASALNVAGGNDAAHAIMTTDTVDKQVAVTLELDGKTVKIGGMCKGSGMIEPNMATMLGFLTTDAAVEAKALDRVLRLAANKSFNRVVVDGDMSTNDTVMVFASGVAGNATLTEQHPQWQDFVDALTTVCIELGKKMVMDGEGATKFVTVRVHGAKPLKMLRRPHVRSRSPRWSRPPGLDWIPTGDA